MRFFDLIALALRNLSRQKLRSFLTILAVVIGSISVTIMLSLVLAGRKALLTSMEQMGTLTAVSVTPSSEIEGGGGNLFQTWSNGDGTKKLLDADVTSLGALDSVIAASGLSSPKSNYMYLEGQTKKYRGQIVGYDPSSHVFDTPVIYGRELEKDDLAKIVLSTASVRNFGYGDHPADIIGQHVMIAGMGGYTAADTEDPPLPPAEGGDKYWEEVNRTPREYTAEVVGVMDGGTDAQDFITLAWTRQLNTSKYWKNDDTKMEAYKQAREAFEQEQQQLMQQDKKNSNGKSLVQPEQFPMPDPNTMLTLSLDDRLTIEGYGSILLKVDDAKNVEAVTNEIIALGYGATSAQEMVDQMTQIFTIIGAILGGIGGIALLVSAIGIVNTMVMAILERTKEIGVMRACGATKSAVRALFAFEAASLGFWGGVIGIGMSMAIAWIATYIVTQTGVSASFPIEGLITFPWWLIASVVGFTTLIGLLAGIYPAVKASKLNPVDALRYE